MPSPSSEQSFRAIPLGSFEYDADDAHLKELCDRYNDVWARKCYARVAELPMDERDQEMQVVLEEIATVTMALHDAIDVKQDERKISRRLQATIRRLDRLVEALFAARTIH